MPIHVRAIDTTSSRLESDNRAIGAVERPRHRPCCADATRLPAVGSEAVPMIVVDLGCFLASRPHLHRATRRAYRPDVLYGFDPWPGLVEGDVRGRHEGGARAQGGLDRGRRDRVRPRSRSPGMGLDRDEDEGLAKRMDEGRARDARAVLRPVRVVAHAPEPPVRSSTWRAPSSRSSSTSTGRGRTRSSPSCSSNGTTRRWQMTSVRKESSSRPFFAAPYGLGTAPGRRSSRRFAVAGRADTRRRAVSTAAPSTRAAAQPLRRARASSLAIDVALVGGVASSSGRSA